MLYNIGVKVHFIPSNNYLHTFSNGLHTAQKYAKSQKQFHSSFYVLKNITTRQKC